MVSQHGAYLISHEWVGLYRNQEVDWLEWMVNACHLKEFIIKMVQLSVVFMDTFPKSIVRLQYFALNEVKPYAKDVDTPKSILGLDLMS